MLTGCNGNENKQKQTADTIEHIAPKNKKPLTLVIGAYSVAKDALQLILPQFAAQWEQKTDHKVYFQQSYEVSSTQAYSIANGMEVDVALFSLEGDVDKLVQAGMVV